MLSRRPASHKRLWSGSSSSYILPWLQGPLMASLPLGAVLFTPLLRVIHHFSSPRPFIKLPPRSLQFPSRSLLITNFLFPFLTLYLYPLVGLPSSSSSSLLNVHITSDPSTISLSPDSMSCRKPHRDYKKRTLQMERDATNPLSPL